MRAKTKIFSAVLAAAALLLAAAPMAAPPHAYAETITIETPKTQTITNARLNEYKGNLFYDGSYVYEEENYTLNYRYYKPVDAQEPMPLILFLHGRGERGSDNDSQLNNAIMRPFIENENSKFYDAMVIAPQCPVKENNNGWVDLFTDNTLDYHNYSVDAVAESVECKAIVSLIGDTCEKNNIDRNRIYLIGVSQGAIATWDLLARHSELFAAAVPIAGVGDVSKADIYADIPI